MCAKDKMKAAFNSLGQYTLTSQVPPPPSRVRLVCPPPLQSAVKHTILKNPVGTLNLLKNPTAVAQLNRKLNLAKSVTIGTHLYVIDPAIYETVMELIGDIPITSLQQLQEIIVQARQMTGTASCLQKIAPVRLIRQYTYRGNSILDDTFHESYPHPYKIGELTLTPPIILTFIDILRFLYDEIVVSYPNTYFLEVIRDDKSAYTHLYMDMFPDGVASKFGSMIQPIPSLSLFNSSGIKEFKTLYPTTSIDLPYAPIICVVRPASWNIYGGSQLTQFALVYAYLDPVTSINNYLYTPIPFRLFLKNKIYDKYNTTIDLSVEKEENEYPIGTNIQFVTTNGGMDYTKTFFGNVFRKFNLSQNVNYKKLLAGFKKLNCKNR